MAPCAGKRFKTAARAGVLALLCLYLLAGPALLAPLASCSSGSQIEGAGTVVVIPSDVPQSGYYTVTCYDDFDGRWASGTGQERVCRMWHDAGSVWTDDIATIDGLYLVACTETFGKVGDKVTFTLTDGTEIPCMIADIKSSGDANYSKWGHMNGDNTNVIEFEVRRSRYMASGNPGRNGWKEGWGGKAVQSCTNHGADAEVSGGLLGCSARQASTAYLEEARAIARDDANGYEWGGAEEPGFDCQGLVKRSLERAGYDVSPWERLPGRGTASAEEGLSAMGFSVAAFDEADLAAGDILIFDDAEADAGHIAVYAGDGRIVDAAADFDGKPGDSSGKEIAERPMSESGVEWQKRARPPAGSGLASCSSSALADRATTEEQRRIVEACMSVPSPPANLCGRWVSQVYAAAGFPYPGGDACDMWAKWCTSADKADLEVGMMVAVPSSPFGIGVRYGHVGIYVGDGKVMHSTGVIHTDDLDDWIATYENNCTAKWGYPPRA